MYFFVGRASLKGRTARLSLVLLQRTALVPGEDPSVTDKASSLCQACDLNTKYLFVLPLGSHVQGYLLRWVIIANRWVLVIVTPGWKDPYAYACSSVRNFSGLLGKLCWCCVIIFFRRLGIVRRSRLLWRKPNAPIPSLNAEIMILFLVLSPFHYYLWRLTRRRCRKLVIMIYINSVTFF